MIKDFNREKKVQSQLTLSCSITFFDAIDYISQGGNPFWGECTKYDGLVGNFTHSIEFFLFKVCKVARFPRKWGKNNLLDQKQFIKHFCFIKVSIHLPFEIQRLHT